VSVAEFVDLAGQYPDTAAPLTAGLPAAGNPRRCREGCKEIGVLVRIWDVEQDRLDFAEFYAAARDDCLRIVLVSVGDRDLAEDLVAEGFTRAWMSWRKVRGHPAPRAWVVRTALNANISWWRRRRREVALVDHDVAARDVAAGTGQDTGLDDPLVTALRRLPLRQREVVALRLLLDLDTETTARTLGISAGTVGVYLHRALEALRGELGPPAPPGSPAQPREAPGRRRQAPGEPCGRRQADCGEAFRGRRSAPDLSEVSR
jgi:RNA polymerase sigma-70 factor (sigma-E family)